VKARNNRPTITPPLEPWKNAIRAIRAHATTAPRRGLISYEHTDVMPLTAYVRPLAIKRALVTWMPPSFRNVCSDIWFVLLRPFWATSAVDVLSGMYAFQHKLRMFRHPAHNAYNNGMTCRHDTETNLCKLPQTLCSPAIQE